MDDYGVLEWADPPTPPVNWRRKYEAVAAQLKAQPGRWARVNTYGSSNAAQSSASKINNSGTPSFPKGQFEAVARCTEDSNDLYLRYVGPVVGDVTEEGGDVPGVPQD